MPHNQSCFQSHLCHHITQLVLVLIPSLPPRHKISPSSNPTIATTPQNQSWFWSHYCHNSTQTVLVLMPPTTQTVLVLIPSLPPQHKISHGSKLTASTTPHNQSWFWSHSCHTNILVLIPSLPPRHTMSPCFDSITATAPHNQSWDWPLYCRTISFGSDATTPHIFLILIRPLPPRHTKNPGCDTTTPHNHLNSGRTSAITPHNQSWF